MLNIRGIRLAEKGWRGGWRRSIKLKMKIDNKEKYNYL
jgi:hypothetical protein